MLIMTVLQEKIVQKVENLSDENLQFLLELINRFMMPNDQLESTKDLNYDRYLSAAGGLHQYADISLIDQEKDVWRKVAVAK